MDQENKKGETDLLIISDKLVQDIIISTDEVNETKNKINGLMEKAKLAKEKKPGFFKGKIEAIEALQEVVCDQSDMINDIWVYNTQMVNQINSLTESTKKLIFLSVQNASYTRAIIEQLKSKTKKPLNERARAHLIEVIKDLERQADVQDRLTRMRNEISNLKEENISLNRYFKVLSDSWREKVDRGFLSWLIKRGNQRNKISNSILNQNFEEKIQNLNIKVQDLQKEIDKQIKNKIDLSLENQNRSKRREKYLCILVIINMVISITALLFAIL